MTGKNILIVEDEELTRELVKSALAAEHFDVMGAGSGEEALEIIKIYLPDLILLDLMLPGINGLELCKILKNDSKTSHIPIIMATTKGAEENVVKGLELGADDYIIKPFSMKILIARINSVLRRKTVKPADKPSVIKFQDLIIDPNRYEVFIINKRVELTSTEFKVLYFLASRPGWVFTRNQILEEIRSGNDVSIDRAVDILIVGLRKKLGAYSKYIETIRGVGYSFNASSLDI